MKKKNDSGAGREDALIVQLFPKWKQLVWVCGFTNAGDGRMVSGAGDYK